MNRTISTGIEASDPNIVSAYKHLCSAIIAQAIKDLSSRYFPTICSCINDYAIQLYSEGAGLSESAVREELKKAWIKGKSIYPMEPAVSNDEGNYERDKVQ